MRNRDSVHCPEVFYYIEELFKEFPFLVFVFIFIVHV